VRGEGIFENCLGSGCVAKAKGEETGVESVGNSIS
jgi:hypothetical protein